MLLTMARLLRNAAIFCVLTNKLHRTSILHPLGDNFSLLMTSQFSNVVVMIVFSSTKLSNIKTDVMHRKSSITS